MAPFISSLKKYGNKNILIIAHGSLNKVMIGTLLGRTLEEASERGQDNCSLSIIEISEKGNKALVINDVGFL